MRGRPDAFRDQDPARASDVGRTPRRVDRGRRDPALRVGLELGPLLPADPRLRRAQLRGVDDAGRDGPGHPANPDRLAGHRADLLRLGAGWNQMGFNAYGFNLPPLKERFDRLDEGAEAIVRLLSQTTTTFAG